MARLLLFGPAREAAGVARTTLAGNTISAVVAAAEAQFGEPFSRILAVSKVWLNGDEVAPDAPVHEDDEVAVIPPVSGG
ncbi:MAG TPA: MoaD/ThiS family protein [Acidimicrobiales bacterium]|nr:MoaD/ThiS family protein [Acidimicrobiales bacterium]